MVIAISYYGPGFFRFFQQQNENIANGSIKEEAAQYLHLDTLGIVNGLMDLVVQGESLISYPYNNVSRALFAFSSSLFLFFVPPCWLCGARGLHDINKCQCKCSWTNRA